MTLDLLHSGVRQVSVDNFGSGSISVDPGTDPDLVEGTISGGESFLSAVQVRQDRDHLRIALPHRPSGSGRAHLRLQVPTGLSLQLTTGSADITISVDIARSRLVSGSGDITLAGATDLSCTTGSGDISIAAVRGDGARVNSGSGDIALEDAHCAVSAKSGSGDVLIRTLHEADLQASSGSGDISVPTTSGSVDLRSASGSLSVGIAGDLPAWLDLNSVSGRIHIALDPSPAPEPGEPHVFVRARTASGEIAVYRA